MLVSRSLTDKRVYVVPSARVDNEALGGDTGNKAVEVKDCPNTIGLTLARFTTKEMFVNDRDSSSSMQRSSYSCGTNCIAL